MKLRKVCFFLLTGTERKEMNKAYFTSYNKTSTKTLKTWFRALTSGHETIKEWE